MASGESRGNHNENATLGILDGFNRFIGIAGAIAGGLVRYTENMQF